MPMCIANDSLVDGAMFQGLLTTGLVNTGAGLGAVLIDAQPLVVALLASPALWQSNRAVGLVGPGHRDCGD